MPRQYEVSQSVEVSHYPQGYADASPAPSGSIVSAQGETLASTTAARGTATAVATVAAGSREVSCDTIANFKVGLPYWLATAGGRGIEVRVVDIDSVGKKLWLAEPVRWAVASGSIKDHRLYLSISSSTNSKVRRACRTAWRYSIGGVARAEHRTLDFVHTPFELAITDADIDRVSATFGAMSGEGGEWSRLKEQAESDVSMALLGAQVKPDLCIERDLLKSAAVYRVLQLRHVQKPELAERFAALYAEQIGLFLGSHTWYDSDDDLRQYTTDPSLSLPAGGRVDAPTDRLPPKRARVS